MGAGFRVGGNQQRLSETVKQITVRFCSHPSPSAAARPDSRLARLPQADRQGVKNIPHPATFGCRLELAPFWGKANRRIEGKATSNPPLMVFRVFWG